MPNILASLAKWTRSALSLAIPMPSRLPEPATASRPCLSGGTDQISLTSQESAMETMRQAIVRVIEQHPGSSRSQVAEALGIEVMTASRELRKLVRGGVLTMTGSKRGARYSIARPLPPAA